MAATIFLYICLFAYSIIFSVLYDSYGTFVLSLLLGMVPLVCFIIGWIQHFFINVEMKETIGMVEKGDETEVTFYVTNKGIFPVSEVRIKFTYKNTCLAEKKDYVSVALGARHKERAILRIPAEYCGPALVTVKSYYVFDPIHLTFIYKRVKKRDKNQAKCRFYIIPKMQEVSVEVPVPRLSEAEESTLYSKVKSGDDPSEIFDIREYHEGDRIHRIHWKLSSKRKTYMVKDFSLPISTSTCVLLSLCIGDGTLNEIENKKKSAPKKGAGIEKTAKKGISHADEEKAARILDERIQKALLFSYTLIQHDFVHEFYWADAVTGELFSRLIQDNDNLFEMILDMYEAGLSTENPLPDLFFQSQHHFRGELYLFGPGMEELRQMGYDPKEVEFDEAQG